VRRVWRRQHQRWTRGASTSTYGGRMDLGLADRVYILTGGTKGLGRATAEALVADGARVVVSSRSQDSVDAAVRALGERARGVAADNAEPGTAQRLTGEALDALGRLDGALVSVGGRREATPSRRPTSSGGRRSSRCSSARSD